MGMTRYHETATSRSSQSLRHPSSINHRIQNHHPSTSMQGHRGHNINFHPQVAAAASYRISSNSSRNAMNSSQNLLEVGRRLPGTVPPTGFRIYRPNRGVIPEAALRHQNLPQLRLLQADVIHPSSLPFITFCLSPPLSSNIVHLFFFLGIIWYTCLLTFFHFMFSEILWMIFLGGCNTGDSRPL